MDKAIDQIWKSSLPGGGFANRPGGQYRPDATAWAVMSLQMCGVEGQRLHAARQCLAASQQEDGRVVLVARSPQLLLAHPAGRSCLARPPRIRRASVPCRFLSIEDNGQSLQATRGQSGRPRYGHQGLALDRGNPLLGGADIPCHDCTESDGKRRQARRVAEGARLLLDRQLSKGGWNYGNTTVFDTELAAMPESTGLALSALSGLVDKQDVSRSIAKLKDTVKTLTTPFSLGWAILGLSAWGERPRDANALIDRCLKRQDRYGTYDTSLMGLMIVARKAEGGLIHAFS